MLTAQISIGLFVFGALFAVSYFMWQFGVPTLTSVRAPGSGFTGQ
jgi:hypothetical protein